tara:strand:+ start:450 stop:776 length:327 start_codon:yes stop_codon:yes gene_type:complete
VLFLIKSLISLASFIESALALISVESLLLNVTKAFTKPRFNVKDVKFEYDMNVLLFVSKNQLGFIKVTPFAQKINFSGLKTLPSKSTLDLKIFLDMFKVKNYLCCLVV